MRGQRPPKFKDEFSIPLLSPKLENLTVVGSPIATAAATGDSLPIDLPC